MSKCLKLKFSIYYFNKNLKKYYYKKILTMHKIKIFFYTLLYIYKKLF